jgi:hypothetical protein
LALGNVIIDLRQENRVVGASGQRIDVNSYDGGQGKPFRFLADLPAD